MRLAALEGVQHVRVREDARRRHAADHAACCRECTCRLRIQIERKQKGNKKAQLHFSTLQFSVRFDPDSLLNISIAGLKGIRTFADKIVQSKYKGSDP